MTQGRLPVAILAGGLATRLHPLTATMPKALLEVNGEPFIAHQLRLLRAHGITRVVICAGYLGDMLQEYVGDGGEFGVQVGVELEGPGPLLQRQMELGPASEDEAAMEEGEGVARVELDGLLIVLDGVAQDAGILVGRP